MVRRTPGKAPRRTKLERRAGKKLGPNFADFEILIWDPVVCPKSVENSGFWAFLKAAGFTEVASVTVKT
jgi:hypothetical protein